ncbi:MAG TPA: carboxypeptidase regulatory-like domain-containing protein [Polyangia bacterium]|nr:carboxypeptidase regulatory-like domain-containing protein [Polyangia bacterium]
MSATHTRRRPQRRPLAVAGLCASLALGGLAFGPRAARAQGQAQGQGKDLPPPTGADFARLEREVAEQRQLLIQVMQVEQERYDILLKLLQGNGQAQPGASFPTMPPVPAARAKTAAAPVPPVEPEAPAPRESTALAVVSGRVQVRGGSAHETYVYLDQIRGAPAHGKTVEIKQKDKQFSPRVAVVQRGTTVMFPNFDSIYHNVFSTSERNSFDLGATRGGDTPRSVVLSNPGVVEIFCNIHSRMSASILVVPSPIYAKVGADGGFRLENVPVGARRFVAWSPGMKAASQKIEVTPSGAQANFTLDEQPVTAHLNKLGQPYGSYKE